MVLWLTFNNYIIFTWRNKVVDLLDLKKFSKININFQFTGCGHQLSGCRSFNFKHTACSFIFLYFYLATLINLVGLVFFAKLLGMVKMEVVMSICMVAFVAVDARLSARRCPSLFASSMPVVVRVDARLDARHRVRRCPS